MKRISPLCPAARRRRSGPWWAIWEQADLRAGQAWGLHIHREHELLKSGGDTPAH